MTDNAKPTPEEVLAEWLPELDRHFLEQAMSNGPHIRRLAEALREALRQRDELAAKLAKACTHWRYAESPVGIRQCKDCYKTARHEPYGWDWK